MLPQVISGTHVFVGKFSTCQQGTGAFVCSRPTRCLFPIASLWQCFQLKHLALPSTCVVLRSNTDDVDCLTLPLPARPSSIEDLPPARLKALRRMALEVRDVIKVGRRGVSAGLISQIHNRWRTSEVARLYCHGRPAADMKALADALQKATSGVVIHRSGGSIYVWRGDCWDALQRNK
jgi:RNA-binding protein YhbY